MTKSLIAGYRRDALLHEPLAIEFRPARSQLFRFGLSNLLISNVERSLRLCGGHISLATRHHTEPLMTPALQSRWRQRVENRRHHQRHTHVGIVCQVDAVETRRRNAKHRHRVFVDEDRLADEVRIFIESAFPKLVAQYNDRMRAGCPIVILCEKPAGPRTNTEHFVKVSTDELTAH